MTKFGINTDSNLKVIEIAFFENGILPRDFFEISEQQYFQFLEIVKPWSTYDGTKLINDPKVESVYLYNQNLSSLRLQLEKLSIEIDLQQRMGESATDTTQQFNQLKTQYNQLKNNPLQ